jgi:hypothetical protein
MDFIGRGICRKAVKGQTSKKTAVIFETELTGFTEFRRQTLHGLGFVLTAGFIEVLGALILTP